MLFAAFSPALADGNINWGGHGSDVLPCTSGGHWVLAPSFGVTGATLHVNGVDYVMSQNGQGSWSADSVGALDSNLTASVSFTGAGDERNSLQLSHCNEGTVPTPTNTQPPEPTPTNTTVPPTPTTPGPTPTTPAPTPTTPGHTPTATPPEQNTAGGTSGSNFLLIGLAGAALFAIGIFFPNAKAKIRH